jgi:hypothetical protein
MRATGRQNFEAHGHACIVCGMRGEGMVTWHHILTRKARPDLTNEPRNLIPVCQTHHNRFHEKGTSHMAENFPRVKNWPINRGWKFDTFLKKWTLHED